MLSLCQIALKVVAHANLMLTYKILTLLYIRIQGSLKMGTSEYAFRSYFFLGIHYYITCSVQLGVLNADNDN